MAKLSGPLLSNNAHGSISNALTFSSRKSCKQVRFQRKQKDVITTGRTTQRDFYAEACTMWNTLTANEKQQWDTFNKG
jgi:hypothetical protein